MASKTALANWVQDALVGLGGHASIVDVCRHIWQVHEPDLRLSGDLFYTWQYDVRWAAYELREAGLMKPEKDSQTYATTQAVAVRRQSEYNPQGVSFGTMLKQIAQNPERLTRDRYLAHFGDDHAREWATAEWAKRFAGDVEDHLDPAIVEHDIAELQEAVEPIKTYVDEHVAHRDSKRSDPPTFGDLNTAIDTLEKLVRKYGSLLRGSGLERLEPTPQEDWTDVFRVPWIRGER